MKWARIDNGTVAEIVTDNPEGKYHPSLQWVQCEDDVSTGYSYDGTFHEPQTVDPSEWRKLIVCGPLQIRRALRSAGLYSQVATFMETAEEEVREAWEYASEFKRLDPLVLGVQQVLGKTDEEVDELFSLALTFN